MGQEHITYHIIFVIILFELAIVFHIKQYQILSETRLAIIKAYTSN